VITQAMTEPETPNRWWLTPLIVGLLFIGGVSYAWQSSDEAKEILAKSFFTIAGTLASPFILETSIAIFGLIAVLTYNQWRRDKNGPDWVEMEVPNSQKTTATETSTCETSGAE
jgi:hypothetical protein